MSDSLNYRVNGAVGGGEPGIGPRFDHSVPTNGYLWWYVDGLSADQQHGVTVIGFIGSVFSPYFKWARRRGADPRNHCCLNVVLYGRPRRWAMTERRAAALRQSARSLQIGPSQMRWDGGTLTVDVDEVCMPIPRRLRGQIRVHVDQVYDRASFLDPDRAHRWWPINPAARIEVDMREPDLRWQGEGYFDTNDGDMPLEDSFRYWNWSRAGLPDGGAAILYDVVHVDGGTRGLALRFARDGRVEDFAPGSDLTDLAPTGWRVRRQTRCESPDSPLVLQTLLDAPFYSRSVIRTRLLGASVHAMHESLDMGRFVSPFVQVCLPFRVAINPFY